MSYLDEAGLSHLWEKITNLNSGGSRSVDALYSNTSGTSGTITLSKSIAEYKFLIAYCSTIFPYNSSNSIASNKTVVLYPESNSRQVIDSAIYQNSTQTFVISYSVLDKSLSAVQPSGGLYSWATSSRVTTYYVYGIK